MIFHGLIDKKRIIYGACILLFVIAVASFFLSNSTAEPVSETRFMLDTICTVTLYDWRGDGGEIIDGAFALCDRYEKMLSATVSSSDIYKINHSGGMPVEVSGETAELLRRAIDYCRLSDGKFDITIFPVKTLWHFGEDQPALPDPNALAKAVRKVDYTKLRVDGATVTLPAGMGIDLGAIAKGFIADRMAGYLRENNVNSAIVDLGGNIYALGNKPDGQLWRVGIRKPFADGEADVVETSDSSVVTSGVYQRYFVKDGKIYHHILNSHDGMPCEKGLYSVTVTAESSEQCDALSTICMLIGYDESIGLLSEFQNVRAEFITSDGELLYYG